VDVGVNAAVEQPDRVLAPVAREVAVVAVDHQEACAHVARELEGRDPGSKREGGEGVAQVVDSSHGLDARLSLCGIPVAAAEVPKIEVGAARGGEEKLRARVAR
jgi:hypothetical protein